MLCGSLSLRTSLEPAPSHPFFLQTVRDIGYRFLGKKGAKDNFSFAGKPIVSLIMARACTAGSIDTGQRHPKGQEEELRAACITWV